MSDKVTKTDAEWREQLSLLAYNVTRKGATERASSHDDFPKTAGVFACTCCGSELFDAETKYDSGSGWPSFYSPLSERIIEERTDTKLLMKRTEVLCAKCDAHLGHKFPDGPQPTGMRYCVNAVALDFKPKD